MTAARARAASCREGWLADARPATVTSSASRSRASWAASPRRTGPSSASTTTPEIPARRRAALLVLPTGSRPPVARPSVTTTRSGRRAGSRQRSRRGSSATPSQPAASRGLPPTGRACRRSPARLPGLGRRQDTRAARPPGGRAAGAGLRVPGVEGGPGRARGPRPGRTARARCGRASLAGASGSQISRRRLVGCLSGSAVIMPRRGGGLGAGRALRLAATAAGRRVCVVGSAECLVELRLAYARIVERAPATPVRQRQPGCLAHVGAGDREVTAPGGVRDRGPGGHQVAAQAVHAERGAGRRDPQQLGLGQVDAAERGLRGGDAASELLTGPLVRGGGGGGPQVVADPGAHCPLPPPRLRAGG